MFTSILAAYDGSGPARAAARLAAACAVRWHATLTLCYALDVERMLIPTAASPSSAFDILQTFRRQSADLVAEQVSACRAMGVGCEALLRDEPALAGILNGAADVRANLIAIGTHARSGVERAFLGSVAEQVLRNSTLPVLTVRTNVEAPAAFRDIVVAIDESACAQHALDMAAEIARADSGILHVLYVVPQGASREKSLSGHDVLHASAMRVRSSGGTVREYDAIGDPGSEICAFAERMNAQLIAMGSHGRKGVAHAVFGSVAEAVVRHALCPVVVAKDS
jgi:nucleotide-binding universal stress UspA family protein